MNRWRRETIATLARLGIRDGDIASLMRCAAVLHTWAEHECNGVIQRDEETNVPYWHSSHDGKRLLRTSDRETGALKRASKIAASYGFKVYHQGDPRGCPLYLYRQSDLDAFASRIYKPEQIGHMHGAIIHSCYNSVGTPVSHR